MKLIRREEYLRKLWQVAGSPEIKVITGIRRVGKSQLLQAFIDEVREKSPQSNIIHVNFNLLEYESLTDYHALNDHIKSYYKPGVPNCVFIDEIEMCAGFEKAINSLHATGRYDIYITGSNAFLMSSDLATLFTGRAFEIPVYPFSLKEFVRYFELADKQEALERYLEMGGMSGSYLYQDARDRLRYLNEGLFRALIIRDIETKRNIRNHPLLESLIDTLMDTMSSITSVRRITNTIKSVHAKASDKTIGSYIAYLCEAFAFFRLRRYDIRGRRYLASQDKYYLTDHAFRIARLGTRNMDYGHTLENIVAVELLRRGYEVYVGTLYQKEIDFIALRADQKIYIQVSDNIADNDTLRRETAPLLAIKDAYPKYLLARTRRPRYQFEGIEVIDLAHWLLEM